MANYLAEAREIVNSDIDTARYIGFTKALSATEEATPTAKLVKSYLSQELSQENVFLYMIRKTNPEHQNSETGDLISISNGSGALEDLLLAESFGQKFTETSPGEKNIRMAIKSEGRDYTRRKGSQEYEKLKEKLAGKTAHGIRLRHPESREPVAVAGVVIEEDYDLEKEIKLMGLLETEIAGIMEKHREQIFAYKMPAFSRRYFWQRLKEAREISAANGSYFGVLFYDANNLKQINDELGHGAGDEYLALSAQVFNDNTRKGDVAARYGGDEFAVLLEGLGFDPETGRFSEEKALEHLAHVKDRIEHAMEEGNTDSKLIRQYGEFYKFTYACGLATATGRDEALNLDRVMEKSDERMMIDKKKMKAKLKEEGIQVRETKSAVRHKETRPKMFPPIKKK